MPWLLRGYGKDSYLKEEHDPRIVGFENDVGSFFEEDKSYFMSNPELLCEEATNKDLDWFLEFDENI
jgi:hypothetical protein